MLPNTILTKLAMFGMLLTQCNGFSFAQEKSGEYADKKYDFSITVAEPWTSAGLQGYRVPGIARAAYSQPGGASIVVFIQEVGQAFEPRFLVDESAKSMEKNLGATTRAKEVRTVAGKQAMWLVVEGPGTGGAIDGKGAVTTSQQWVAIPREKDVLVVLLTSPTADFEKNQKSFEQAIESLVVGGSQTAAQSASK